MQGKRCRLACPDAPYLPQPRLGLTTWGWPCRVPGPVGHSPDGAGVSPGGSPRVLVRSTTMRQAKSGPGRGERALIGLVALAVLVPTAWAYVNGVDYHTTLGKYEKRLKTEGWG